MALHTDFSRRSGHAADGFAGPGRRGAHVLATGSGAFVGAVLAGAAGAWLFGPVGTWCGLVLGALVAAVAGRRIVQARDGAREDTFWRERPYVDTAIGSLEGVLDLDLDLDQPTAPEHEVNWQPRAGGLGDIAANPTSHRSRGLSRSGSGSEGAPNWMRDSRRSLGDLAASRPL